jgi:c-di-GMP-binding flagellar brake protein YcgR
MSQCFRLSQHEPAELLAEAVSRRSVAGISCKLTDGWASFKSCFLGIEDETRNLIIEYPAPKDLPPPEFTGGESIGISFRRGHRKCVFSTGLLGQCRFPISRGVEIPALKLLWPNQMYELQRRLFYRAPVPAQETIPVDIRRIAASEKDTEARLYRGHMVDLSFGGLSLMFERGQHPRWDNDDMVACSFDVDNEGSFSLDTRFRYCEQTSPEHMRLGLQFAGLETSTSGRELLDRLLVLCARFQQAERTRLSDDLSPT